MLLRVGLVGYGTAGKYFHGPLLQDHNAYTITHVVERSSEKSKLEWPQVTVVRSIEELVKVDTIDLVVIATPTACHYEQAKLCLQAKKHVVVDKPFTLTFAQATELEVLAQDQGCILSVFQNRRWDSDFLTVKRIIETQMVGKVEYVELHFDRYRPELKSYWKETAGPGSGILYDVGVHIIDQALQLFGVPDKIVRTEIDTQRPGGQTVDYFKLEFLSNADVRVVVTGGMLVDPIGPKFVVRGSTGTFRKSGQDVQEAQLRQGKLPSTTWNFGVEPEKNRGELRDLDGHLIKVVDTEKGQYMKFYDILEQAIVHGKYDKEFVHAHQAAATIRIIETVLAIEAPASASAQDSFE